MATGHAVGRGVLVAADVHYLAAGAARAAAVVAADAAFSLWWRTMSKCCLRSGSTGLSLIHI